MNVKTADIDPLKQEKNKECLFAVREAILSQPHGLRRLMTGKLHFPAQADADHKRHKALELALLISEHLVKNGGQFQDVYLALKRYLQESMEDRHEEDAAIREENKKMALIHKVLAADMANKRQGRVKPDELTAEECDLILRYGAERARKGTEILYWLHIADMMAKGHTPEEAPNKIYQQLVTKGELKTQPK
jgi:hypothetical protein